MNQLAKGMTAVFGMLFGVLLASEMALADDMGGMNGMPDMSSGMGGMSAAATVGHGRGIVKAIDRKAGTVTLKHGPVKEFGWSGMTMTFALRHPSELKSLKKGEDVYFDVAKDSQGSAVITKIRPVP